jgi:hypothetical protein
MWGYDARDFMQEGDYDLFVATFLMPPFTAGVPPPEEGFIYAHSGVPPPVPSQEEEFYVPQEIELVDSSGAPWVHPMILPSHAEVVLPRGNGPVRLHLVSFLPFILSTCSTPELPKFVQIPRSMAQQLVNAVNSARAFTRRTIAMMVSGCGCDAADIVVRL